jgi:hypothetical protein
MGWVFLIGKSILNSLFNAKAIHVLAPYYDQCFFWGGQILSVLSTKYWGILFL